MFEPDQYDLDSVYILNRDHMETMREAGATMQTEDEFAAYLATVMRPGTSDRCVKAMACFYWVGCPQYNLLPIGPYPGSGRPDAKATVGWADTLKNTGNLEDEQGR